MPHMVGPRNQPASSLNEGQARYILIDPSLRVAGWNLEDRALVGFEIPVDGYFVERLSDHDDDWITFKLQGPDPATAPFRVR